MLETILVVSYIAISLLSCMMNVLLAPVLILAYTYLYAYIASFFVTKEGIWESAFGVYSGFSYVLIALSLLWLLGGNGKKLNQGKLISVILNKIKKQMLILQRLPGLVL